MRGLPIPSRCHARGASAAVRPAATRRSPTYNTRSSAAWRRGVGPRFGTGRSLVMTTAAPRRPRTADPFPTGTPPRRLLADLEEVRAALLAVPHRLSRPWLSSKTSVPGRAGRVRPWPPPPGLRPDAAPLGDQGVVRHSCPRGLRRAQPRLRSGGCLPVWNGWNLACDQASIQEITADADVGSVFSTTSRSSTSLPTRPGAERWGDDRSRLRRIRDTRPIFAVSGADHRSLGGRHPTPRFSSGRVTSRPAPSAAPTASAVKAGQSRGGHALHAGSISARPRGVLGL